MSDKKSAREPIAEDARIDALEERLKAAREREEERNEPMIQGTDADTRVGNKVLADLLAGILGGALIGWTVDQFADTSPWGLLVMLFLGIIVAFRNIFRLARAPTVDPSKGQEKRDK